MSAPDFRCCDTLNGLTAEPRVAGHHALCPRFGLAAIEARHAELDRYLAAGNHLDAEDGGDADADRAVLLAALREAQDRLATVSAQATQNARTDLRDKGRSEARADEWLRALIERVGGTHWEEAIAALDRRLALGREDFDRIADERARVWRAMEAAGWRRGSGYWVPALEAQLAALREAQARQPPVPTSTEVLTREQIRLWLPKMFEEAERAGLPHSRVIRIMEAIDEHTAGLQEEVQRLRAAMTAAIEQIDGAGFDMDAQASEAKEKLRAALRPAGTLVTTASRCPDCARTASTSGHMGWSCCQCKTFNVDQQAWCGGCGHVHRSGTLASAVDEALRERLADVMIPRVTVDRSHPVEKGIKYSVEGVLASIPPDEGDGDDR